MARTRKKSLNSAEPAADTSFDPSSFDVPATAAEIVHGVAESTRLPDDREAAHAHGHSHADRVLKREPIVQSGLTYSRSDAVAGVKQGEVFRLVGEYKVREAVIAFAEKPSREVVAAMHDAGFAWKPADKIWTYTVGHQTAAQDRLHAERTFDQVAAMLRREKGISHDFGG